MTHEVLYQIIMANTIVSIYFGEIINALAQDIRNNLATESEIITDHDMCSVVLDIFFTTEAHWCHFFIMKIYDAGCQVVSHRFRARSFHILKL